MKQSELDFIQSLRQSSRYIEQHRAKTMVIYLPGELLDNSEQLTQLAKDITLLHNLNINLVLAMGATVQINRELQSQNHIWQEHNGCRITPTEILPTFQQTIGQVRSQLEAIFCATSHQQTQPLSIVSGNWVIAKPKGVIDGIDYQHTGSLRKVNVQDIRSCLDAKQIVLLTPLAYSLTGEVFNLNTFEQACEIAHLIQADKLMIFDELDIWQNPQSQKPSRQLSQHELRQQLQFLPKSEQIKVQQLLNVSQKVQRIHLLPKKDPAALLYELFTRDGSGLLIFSDHYHQIRAAKYDDIPAIIELIKPLEEQGVLVKRSRERLELEISNFTVVERDQQIIGCAALYLYEEVDRISGELACLAIHPQDQGQQLGEQLLTAIIDQAKSQQLSELFLLTTHTYHWFIEHGFQLKSPKDLPAGKQQLYNYQRQSKVLIKPLNNLS